jgi:hypothetical protein
MKASEAREITDKAIRDDEEKNKIVNDNTFNEALEYIKTRAYKGNSFVMYNFYRINADVYIEKFKDLGYQVNEMACDADRVGLTIKW